jgi:hypothetical protein
MSLQARVETGQLLSPRCGWLWQLQHSGLGQTQSFVTVNEYVHLALQVLALPSSATVTVVQPSSTPGVQLVGHLTLELLSQVSPGSSCPLPQGSQFEPLSGT